jgi:uncharacterized protein (DUF2147 family)
MRKTPLLAATLLASVGAFAASPAATTGDWQTRAGSVIRIQPCGPSVCAIVVKLPTEAPETTDTENPNPALRTRPLCGLTVGSGFHQDDPTHLSGGHLYDPKSGHTYKGTITADDNTLHLRGYIGISLFGRSDTWKRIPTITPCHP